MHQNQEGENSQLVKKSFQKWRKSFKEMPDLQYTIIDLNEVDIRIYLPEKVNITFKGR